MNTGADINVIAANLTELLQNSVNMASVFYDIFLNPEPMDVELTQIDASGVPQTILIPNRAKDMIVATVGQGNPEGVVEAGEGKLYVDEETRVCYVKTTGTGATGWQVILTEEGVYTYIDNYLREAGLLNEETLEEYLVTNHYTTDVDVNNIVASSNGVRFITSLPSAGSILLEDNSVYKLTPITNIILTPPPVTDLTTTHRIFIQLNLTSTDYEINLGTVNFFDKTAPDFSEAGIYDIVFEYDVQTGVWVAGVTPKGAATNVSLDEVNRRLNSVEELIPAEASSTNQLADKDYVNNAVSTNTANFIGTFNSLAELEAYTGDLTNNDYAFVVENEEYNRYKYNATDEEWLFEYTINSTSFTTEQWEAINSGITEDLVALIGTGGGGGVDASYDSETESIDFESGSAMTVATFVDETAGTTVPVTELTINRMTKAEYESITPSATELYVITDEEHVIVDTALDATSTNPVQNKVIYEALANLSPSGTITPTYTIDTVLDATSTNPVQNKVIYEALMNYAPGTASADYTALDTKIINLTDALDVRITDLASIHGDDKTELSNSITTNYTTLNNRITSVASDQTSAISSVNTLGTSVSTLKTSVNALSSSLISVGTSVDTLNSSAVKTSGNQTIAGNKTFTGDVNFNGTTTFSGTYSYSGAVSVPESDAVGSAISTAAISKSANGYVKLGNGILIQWGYKSGVNQGTNTISFNTAFSASPRVVTQIYDNQQVSYYASLMTSISPTNFKTYVSQSNSHGLFWIAIGY